MHLLTVERQLSGRVALWWAGNGFLLWDILPSARKTEKQVAISDKPVEIEKQDLSSLWAREGNTTTLEGSKIYSKDQLGKPKNSEVLAPEATSTVRCWAEGNEYPL